MITITDYTKLSKKNKVVILVMIKGNKVRHVEVKLKDLKLEGVQVFVIGKLLESLKNRRYKNVYT